ncbi:ankyrin repeat domain-containing protein [Acidovorax sp. ACV02]|uniref:ankyrin repeat domain-containing protein n=1 Tax=Acidovorax sp. ACV02 TaxID=2769310 RepID=UPI0017869087|nr:ankyrin repeat domain-containing protein [Acidovorax sp. ACV02]
MTFSRLTIFLAALLMTLKLHASSPPCRFTYGSAFLDTVAEGDVSLVEEQVRQLGTLPPSLGAEALAVSIKPISSRCQEQHTNQAMFELLVKLGADVNRPSKGERGWETSLMHAIDAGQMAGIKLALQAGARVNVEFDERTPLILAIRAHNTTLVRMLLDHGASANFALGRFTPLAAAARHPGQGNEVLKLLLKHGAKISRHRTSQSEQFSPLEELIFYDGKPDDADEAVALLLKAGDKINGDGRDSYVTPLSVAMDSSSTKLAIVEALLRRGANPNGSALYRLATRRDYENIELKRKQLLGVLYQYGARAEKAKIAGYPPIREFVLMNHNDDVGQAFLRELDAITVEYRLRENSASIRR